MGTALLTNQLQQKRARARFISSCARRRVRRLALFCRYSEGKDSPAEVATPEPARIPAGRLPVTGRRRNMPGGTRERDLKILCR